MSRHQEPPDGFVCPWRDRCPELDQHSTSWILAEYQRGIVREREHGRVRDEMSAEIESLADIVRKQAAEIDLLTAENKHLHQSRFKPRTARKTAPSTRGKKAGRSGVPSSRPARKRGAPVGHAPWSRTVPDHIDRTVEVAAPCTCPHCQEATDRSKPGSTSYLQEDIVLRPRTIVTRWVHETAWCPGCRRKVFATLEGELPFAPIGPTAKAAALYLRHETKLPYRKLQKLMSDLFGLDFVPASSLGFEKRARGPAQPVYDDLIRKMRHCDLVHADETYWREDGENVFIWYAGNEEVAVYRIDSHRSAEAAKQLLGERIHGLLVTDAYASYNAVQVDGRQSCLAHLLRKAKEISDVLAAMKTPDRPSVRFCRQLARLLRFACHLAVPTGKRAREKLTERMLRTLDRICGSTPLTHPKTETLRSRLVPGAREYDEVFAFIRFGGPPTNNHAERALRPLVIFRKVCLGSRSRTGSENIAIFSSLAQTTKLQEGNVIGLFQALFAGSASQIHAQVFPASAQEKSAKLLRHRRDCPVLAE
jgi:transposase